MGAPIGMPPVAPMYSVPPTSGMPVMPCAAAPVEPTCTTAGSAIEPACETPVAPPPAPPVHQPLGAEPSGVGFGAHAPTYGFQPTCGMPGVPLGTAPCVPTGAMPVAPGRICVD